MNIFCTFALPPASAQAQLHFSSFARASGKQIAAVTGAMCQVGVACSHGLHGRNSEDVGSHAFCCSANEPSHSFQLLVGNLLERSAVTSRKFNHVGIRPRCEKCCNFSFSPLSHLMLNQGEKENRRAELMLLRVGLGGAKRL